MMEEGNELSFMAKVMEKVTPPISLRALSESKAIC